MDANARSAAKCGGVPVVPLTKTFLSGHGDGVVWCGSSCEEDGVSWMGCGMWRDLVREALGWVTPSSSQKGVCMIRLLSE